jgi:hypothetical protein
MISYETTYFGLRLQIPDGWDVQTWPDDGMEEFARSAASWKPAEPPSICFGATRTLVYATLSAPGSICGSDACIDFKACVQSDECMLHTDGRKPLKKWKLNGLEVLYEDSVGDYPPENVYYRFPRWKISSGLWLYASIHAPGKARFDYAISVFETLIRLKSRSNPKRMPLIDRDPWNVLPSLFRMSKRIREDVPLFDLALESEMTREEYSKSQGVLSGWTGSSPRNWKPIPMRRKSRTRIADCYYGPKGALISSGIFSSRAIEVLRPYMNGSISLLPCTVNGKPHYFLCYGEGMSCLDAEKSQIKRFDDGRIMTIDRYRFKKNLLRDPLLFAIPEAPGNIFATASIPSIAARAELTGIAFHPVDGNGREYTYPASGLGGSVARTNATAKIS